MASAASRRMSSRVTSIRNGTTDPATGVSEFSRIFIQPFSSLAGKDSTGSFMPANTRWPLLAKKVQICSPRAVYRGRIDSQDSLQWENMFKNNVMGCLRTARAFIGLLRPTRGRLILLGSGNEDDGLTVFTATRNAVQGCADALRKELRPYGVNVVTLDSRGVPAEALFKAPIPYTISDEEGVPTQYSAEVLTSSALGVIERALYDSRPSETYCLSVPNPKFQVKLPCRSSFKITGVGSGNGCKQEPKQIQNV